MTDPRTADFARDYVRKGLDPAHRHPSISPRVATVMVDRLLRAPNLEHLWICRWDPIGERLTGAAWLVTGSKDRLVFPVGGIDPGLVLVHNHPGATWEGQLEPSDDDLDTGGRLLLQGIGTALVSNDLGSFVMLYPPTPPAPHPTTRSWSLGGPRFGVTFRFPTTLRSSTR